MGIANESVVGEISGKVGGHTLRKRYDKTVVSENCKEFHKSESEASKAVRNKIDPMCSFARNVNAFPELKEIWKNTTNVKAKAPFYKIERFNGHLMNPLRPTINNRIVPGSGFQCPVNSLAFDHTGIRMEIRPASPNPEIIPFIKYYSALFIMCLYEPVDTGVKYYMMQRSRTELTDCEPGKAAMIEIPFNEEQGKAVKAYKKWILYFVLVVRDDEGRVLGHSMEFNSEREFSGSDNSEVQPTAVRGIKVRLKLSEYWMKNMAVEKFMLTQNFYKNKEEEGIFEFEVKDPAETLFWVIGLGGGVEVLEPWDLRAKIIKLAEDVIGNYKRG
jgi:hypothetical protein